MDYKTLFNLFIKVQEAGAEDLCYFIKNSTRMSCNAKMQSNYVFLDNGIHAHQLLSYSDPCCAISEIERLEWSLFSEVWRAFTLWSNFPFDQSIQPYAVPMTPSTPPCVAVIGNLSI